MKIKYSNTWVPEGYNGITLWPFGVYLSKEKYITNKKELKESTINHESIHWEQQKELAGIFFYLLYLIEWIVKIIKYRDKSLAYRNLSSEREAFFNADDESYLMHRKRYSWLKYISKEPKK